MKVEVAVLGSPSLIVLMVSVDVKQHLKKKTGLQENSDVDTHSKQRPQLCSTSLESEGSAGSRSLKL